jgi:Histidine phosphatase superfamily (branch 2)
MYLIRRHFVIATFSASLFARTTCSNEENVSSSIEQAATSIYNLKHVIVITRHGDRAPISKSIGPNFPHSSEVDDLWRSKIVSGVNEELLKGVAKSQSNIADDNIYTGRDVADIPFGQLTDVGANQLKLLGSNLREKYVIRNKFLPEVLTGDVIYTRSGMPSNLQVAQTLLFLSEPYSSLVGQQ